MSNVELTSSLDNLIPDWRNSLPQSWKLAAPYQLLDYLHIDPIRHTASWEPSNACHLRDVKHYNIHVNYQKSGHEPDDEKGCIRAGVMCGWRAFDERGVCFDCVDREESRPTLRRAPSEANRIRFDPFGVRRMPQRVGLKSLICAITRIALHRQCTRIRVPAR
jgi:hypothetical protein